MEEENKKIQNKLPISLNQLKAYLSNNLTQIIIVFITLFPTIIITFATFTSIWFSQNISLNLINDFAEQLFQDQIQSSKQQNIAVIFQLNSQVQKIPWQLNLLNEFQGKNLLNTVIQNQKHIPAIHNIDRSFLMKENMTVLNMFLKNQILTSVWHHVNISYLEKLDERQIKQMNYGVRLDSIWKAIKFDNQNQNSMWLQIKDIFAAHDYDGMIYMTSINTTYSTYPIPPGCPFNGTYKFDIRCRFYYKPTMADISTVLYDPQVFYTNAKPYLASVFCQRRLRYYHQDPNSEAEKYSVLCITLDLTQTPQYFQNFGQNSKFQIILDPRKLTVIYDSLINIKRDQILKVQQAETDYLQDQNQAKMFLENISLMSQYVLDKKDNIKQFYLDPEQLQRTYLYNRNGTECFVIQNLVTMIDKIPSFEILKSGSTSKKFQLKSAFIFLDVLSKEKMTQYSNDLQTKIKYYNKMFGYCCWVLIILATIFQLYFSIILGRQLIHPIIHLTNILKQIKIKNQNIQQQNQNNFKESLQATFQTQNTIIRNQKDSFQSDASIVNFEDQIQLEFNIDSDFDGICFSSDTQELLNSFQNMFKILKFTNSNILKQNESTSLLNLNMQVQYFEKFCNYRALGVCYNNIGVIHFNSGRYQESVENFQKAVIFAKYELNIYSNQIANEEFSRQIERLTTIFNINNLENKNKTISQDIDNNQQKCKTSKLSFGKYDQTGEKDDVFQYQFEDLIENEQLYWNLFNRKENLLKSLSNYLNSNSGLWDIFQEFAKENAIISKIFLPPSYKRDMFNYYPMLVSYFKSNDMVNTEEILKKISILYIKNYERKNNIAETKTEKPQTISNFANKVQVLQNNMFVQNIQDSQFLQHKISVYSNQNSEIDTSQVLMTPIKKSIVKKQTLKLKEGEKEQLLNINDQKRLSNLVQGILDNVQQLQNQKQKQKNLSLSIFQNQEFNFKVKKESIYQDETNFKIKKESSFKNKYNKSKQNDQISQNEKNINKSTQISKKEVYKMTRKSNFLNSMQIHHLYNTKKRFQTFYKVRKCKNTNKLSRYEFSSDINFMYYALSQAQFQVQNQNFYKAATILTNTLESCRYYLPHLKIQALNNLSNIFCSKNIIVHELEEIKNQYIKYTNCNFHVQIISACCQKKSNKKICKISSDMLNDILFKDSDSFGLVNYSFSENIFEQFMAQISIQVVKSYSNLLQLLLVSFIKKYIQNDLSNINQSLLNLENNNSFIQDQDIKNMTQLTSYRYNQSMRKLNKSGFIQQQNIQQNKQIFSLAEEKKYDEANSQLNLQENTNNIEKLQNQINSNSPNINKNYSQIKKIQNQLVQQSISSLIPNYQFGSLSKFMGIYSSSNTSNKTNKVEILNKNKKTLIFNENTQNQNYDLDQSSQNSINIYNKKRSFQELNYEQSPVIFDNMKNQEKYYYQQHLESSPCKLINGDSDRLRKDKLTFNLPFSLDNQFSNEKQSIFKNDKPNGDEQINFDQLSQSNISLKQASSNTYLNNINESFSNKFKENNQLCEMQKNNFQSNIQSEKQLYQNQYDCLIADQLLTQNQESNQIKDDKLENQTKYESIFNNQNVNQNPEQLFHRGVHAALKQFILNTNEKINIYLSLKKYKESQKNKQFYPQKQNQIILIYITDLQLEFKNTNLINDLSQLLLNLDIQLLVLTINQQQQTLEYDELQDIIISGKYIIKFFNNEQKLLQYIYNQREHVKNNLMPMMIEYF
ncbi:hypothetical protein ABPG74_020479 [Tetrahymena malaccensis]